MKDKRVNYVITCAVLFIVYFATAKSSLNLYPGSQTITVIWPPAGIALAAVLLFGYGIWPAIAAAVLVLDVTLGFSFLAVLEQIVALTAEPLLGAYLLKRFGKINYAFDRVIDVLYFIVLAGIISTLAGATVGVLSLLHVGAIHHTVLIKSWAEWWIGDMLGVIVITPLLLVWSRQQPKKFLQIRRLAEAAILVVSLSIVSIFVFHGFNSLGIKPFILAYLVFPLLIWIAIRFKQLGSVTAIFIVSLLAIEGTITSFFKSGAKSITFELLLLQTFIGVTAVTFMIIAAGVAESEASQQRQLKLAAKTARLTKQKTQLEELGKAKDDFIAIASHQLKTPPTIIKQLVSLLVDGYAGKLTSKQQDMLSRVYETNEKQLKVIRDILNVAQIDTGNVTLRKENTDVAPIIKDILHDKSAAFARHNQEVLFTFKRGKFIAFADRVKLYMVIENIVDNAGKYTPDGKKIEVRLSKNKAFVIIAIKDEGIGLSKEDRRKIFKKFTRIRKDAAASVDGTGIGLYWAKKIIDLHGGNISVTSSPNRGSTFTIEVPAAPAKKAAER